MTKFFRNIKIGDDDHRFRSEWTVDAYLIKSSNFAIYNIFFLWININTYYDMKTLHVCIRDQNTYHWYGGKRFRMILINLRIHSTSWLVFVRIAVTTLLNQTLFLHNSSTTWWNRMDIAKAKTTNRYWLAAQMKNANADILWKPSLEISTTERGKPEPSEIVWMGGQIHWPGFPDRGIELITTNQTRKFLTIWRRTADLQGSVS